MSEQRPARTIYKSAAGAASAAPAAGTSGKRRRLRDAWWLAPVLALILFFAIALVAGFFLLGGFGLLQYVGVTTSGQQLTGTWGSADTSLGATVSHIAKGGDGLYTLSGIRVLGQRVATAQVKDDSLSASGVANGVSWQLSLSFVNRDQLRATVTYGDGRPPLETLLTRQ